MGDIVELKKPLSTWAPNEEQLGWQLNEQYEFQITNKGQLLQMDWTIEECRRQGIIEEDEHIVHSFYLPSLSPKHTTDYLRWACEELYPEVDFDAEFETDSPGVWERVGEDIMEKARQMKVEALKEKINELGYKLVFHEEDKS